MVSNIGTSTNWPRPLFVRSNNAASTALANARPAVLSAISDGM